MCYFITATLPKDADLSKSAEVFNAYHLNFKEIENESVRKHLENGDFYIFTTNGICDCGTVLASQGAGKYQPSELNDEKIKRDEAQTHEHSMMSVEDWINFIHDILGSKATKRIGILVHEYKESLDSKIKILGKITVPLEKLTIKFLVEMSEDVIYDFTL